MSTTEHWQDRWSSHDHGELSWFQSEPEPSLGLVTGATPTGAEVVDVGGGASMLADRLLDLGYRPVVVDLAAAALDVARRRLGDRAGEVEFVVGDVTGLDLGRRVATWHDRAVLHFLVDEGDRAAYVEAVGRTVAPGGHVVIGTFAPDGPTHCSGLPVRRHDAADLEALLAPLGAALVEHRAVTHETPGGGTQAFTFVVLRLP